MDVTIVEPEDCPQQEEEKKVIEDEADDKPVGHVLQPPNRQLFSNEPHRKRPEHPTRPAKFDYEVMKKIDMETDFLARKRDEMRRAATEAMKIAELRRTRQHLEDEKENYQEFQPLPVVLPVSLSGEVLRDPQEQERLERSKQIKEQRIKEHMHEMAELERIKELSLKNRNQTFVKPQYKLEADHWWRNQSRLGPLHHCQCSLRRETRPKFASTGPLLHSTPKVAKVASTVAPKVYRYEVEELKAMNPYRKQ